MNTDLWNELGASATALQKLQDFAALAEKWTKKINLVSRGTIAEIWTRHIEDSAHIMKLSPDAPQIWADFGSGGGFPGIVVATLLQDRALPTRVILVESDQRKSAFLREASRQLGLSVQVRAERAEQIAGLNADVISARALASLDMLCTIVERHIAPKGIALFPKGETWEEEVAQARKNWLFDLEAAADPGHKGSAILKLRKLRRASSDARS